MTISPGTFPLRRLGPDAPRVITLCGAPEAGKTRAQIILERLYGAIAIDDGAIIRRGAMAMYGLSQDDVSTQEGKRRMIRIPGGEAMAVRDLLGKLGNHLEAMHGPGFIPLWALKEGREIHGSRALLSFGSVRRNQAAYYKTEEPSLCLEIRREGAEIRREFDRYDETCVDISIENPWREGCDPAEADLGLQALISTALDPLMLEKTTTLAV